MKTEIGWEKGVQFGPKKKKIQTDCRGGKCGGKKQSSVQKRPRQ